MKECASETQILVRLLRAVRSATQEELAEEANLDLSSIHRYETDQMNASKDALERMAKAAGISPTFLHTRLEPFVRALRVEALGEVGDPQAGIDVRAEEIGRRVGAVAREEALAFLSGSKPDH